MLEGGQGVGGLAGLGDHDHQGVGFGHRFAVAVFGGDLDGARDLGDGLEPVAGGEAGVVAGAAGEDQHAAGGLEHVDGLGAEDLRADDAAAGDDLEGVGQRLGLLEDLLLHVVAVLAQLDRIGGQAGDVHRALDGGAVGEGDAVAVEGELGHVAVLEVDHLAGDLQQCGGVGGGVVAVLADAQQQRRALAGDDGAARVGLGEHADGVGADELGDGGTHRVEEVGDALELVVEQVGDGLGVGLGREGVALGLQARAQLGEVLDDAVVHHGEAAGDVRVGVALGGHAVGGPAGVGDADAGLEAGGVGLGGEFGHAADGAQAGELGLAFGLQDGQAGGVIAAVFQLAQTFEQHGDDVATGNGGDDATHRKEPL